MDNSVRVERRGHVLEVTLDRPKVNAIDVSPAAAGEPSSPCATIRAAVGIVTGGGDRIFSAGWTSAAHAATKSAVVGDRLRPRQVRPA